MNRGLWLGLIVVNLVALLIYSTYTNNETLVLISALNQTSTTRIELSQQESVTPGSSDLQEPKQKSDAEVSPQEDKGIRDDPRAEIAEPPSFNTNQARNGHAPDVEAKNEALQSDAESAPPPPELDTLPPENVPEKVDRAKKPKPDPSSCILRDLQFHRRSRSDHNGQFQRVGPDTYVYEAYYDARKNVTTYVRLIGVSPLNSTVFCHVWFEGTHKPLTMQAEIYVRLYHKSVPYKSVLVNCPFNRTSDDAAAPAWVVLSSTKCGPPEVVLPVVDNRKAKLEANFTVCLHKALYNNYGWPELLVEWIEINRVFGAQKFLMYYYNHSHSLLPYIEHYIQEGIMEYRSWPLQAVDDKISVYKAQVSVINDCIYRSMYKTKYLALLDPDELMVPQIHDNWNDLMENAPCTTEPGIMFRNHIFVLNQPMDELYTKNETLSSIRMDSVSHTLRQNFSWPCYIRTKLMVRPERVIDCDTHVTEMWKDCCLPPSLGTLHHYREWFDTVKQTVNINLRIFGLNKNMQYHDFEDNMVQDRRIYHWIDQIYPRIKHVFEVVNGTKT